MLKMTEEKSAQPKFLLGSVGPFLELEKLEWPKLWFSLWLLSFQIRLEYLDSHRRASGTTKKISQRYFCPAEYTTKPNPNPNPNPKNN